jgi:hypothetical protein
MVEPYRDQHAAFKSAYLEAHEQWRGWPSLRRLAEQLCSKGPRFLHVDETQLITRLLALRAASATPDRIGIVYLWYDVPVAAGDRHRQEAIHFGNVLKRDGIVFTSVTCQEVLARLRERCTAEHATYLDWMSGRYA